jgi:hypothetical protein
VATMGILSLSGAETTDQVTKSQDHHPPMNDSSWDTIETASQSILQLSCELALPFTFKLQIELPLSQLSPNPYSFLEKVWGHIEQVLVEDIGR